MGEASKYKHVFFVVMLLALFSGVVTLSVVGPVYHNANDEDILLIFISNLPIFDMFVAEVDLMTHSWIFKQNVMEFMTDQNSKLRYTIAKQGKPMK